jgi:hypothetical protein
MGKITTYMAVLSVVIIGFHFGGLISETPISWLMDAILNPENLDSNAFFTTIQGILAIFAGGGIIVGTLISQKVEQGATVAFTSLLFLIGWDLIAIFNIVAQTSRMLATFLVSPLLLVYILSVIEWWRGKD